jgi:hypothetical protein
MSILTEAEKIINGDRAEAYGSPLVMGEKLARGWEVILGLETGSMTAEQANLCMLWLKICRETNKHQKDNLVDMAGYAGVIEKIHDERMDGNGFVATHTETVEVPREVTNVVDMLKQELPNSNYTIHLGEVGKGWKCNHKEGTYSHTVSKLTHVVGQTHLTVYVHESTCKGCNTLMNKVAQKKFKEWEEENGNQRSGSLKF